MTPSKQGTIREHIVCTPGICGGRPRIDGHRIRVQDIVALHDVHGYSIERILEDAYPQLTRADIYAALAYYEDNRELVGTQFKQDDELVERLMGEQGPGLLQKIIKEDG